MRWHTAEWHGRRAAPQRATASPAGPRGVLAGLGVSAHALNVLELIHALDQVNDHLEPIDVLNFSKLLPRMRGSLVLQIMVAMTKHPLFAADLALNAQHEPGEILTHCLARDTHVALEKHSQRIRSQDVQTLLCHTTLDHNIGYVAGIAAWRQRLNLISKEGSSVDGATATTQDRLAIGTAGKEYFWTGDTTRLQALVLP